MPQPERPLHPPLAVVLAVVVGALSGCSTKGGKTFNEGQQHLKKGRYEQAIKAFKRTVTENPEFGEAYYNLGAAQFQLAARKLDALVKRQGSPALKAALKATVPHQGNQAVRRARLGNTLKRELVKLPAGETGPVTALLRASIKSKLEARRLFKQGKWVAVRKPRDRKRILAQLDSVAELAEIMNRPGATRGRLLLAIARPELIARAGTTPKKP